LNEGLQMTRAGIMLSADSECNEQRAAEAGQQDVKMIALLF